MGLDLDADLSTDLVLVLDLDTELRTDLVLDLDTDVDTFRDTNLNDTKLIIRISIVGIKELEL